MKIIAIAIPVYNEGQTIQLHLHNINSVIHQHPDHAFHAIVIDDGSTDQTIQAVKEINPNNEFKSITVLKLHYNIGHQKAIMQGVLYAVKQAFDHLIVMDGDGEDDPQAISEMLKHQDKNMVFVARGRRHEGFWFSTFYKIYQIIFKMITGKAIRFGNYSMISHRVMLNVADNSFIHYSAYLSRLKYSHEMITFDRAKRLGGRSKMNFSSLVHHGFKSLVEYAENTLITLFKLFMVIVLLIITVVLIILYKKFISYEAIIGWTSNMFLGLLNLAMITFGFFILGVFLLNLSSKYSATQVNKIYEELHIK